MEFLEEKIFDREQYDTYIRRIHYDDRDAVMYEKMLHFLFPYIVEERGIEDKEGLMEEYIHWNGQLIEKCLYHLPHDIPYINICRAYQSVVFLFAGNIKEGMEQLRRIGTENFQYDGKAPKSIMTQDGKVYKPVSKLFLLYNYAKVLKQKGMQGELEAFQKEYPYAFTIYGDEEHREHDLFYKEQMGQYKDVIFYPVYQRVYKIGRGPQVFLFIMTQQSLCLFHRCLNNLKLSIMD